jgi:toxin-antitoxin system PIN domain toxin
MVLCDVNVLVYAFRKDAKDHERYQRWLDDAVNSDEAFGYSEMVLAGLLRIVTNRRIFPNASPLDIALRFCEQMREQPNAVRVDPASRHWEIFRRLCEQSGANGNLVSDAYLAALAIESGCEWITTDRDYARFKGLRWRHPLEQK